jgi:hypothetical protein
MLRPYCARIELVEGERLSLAPSLRRQFNVNCTGGMMTVGGLHVTRAAGGTAATGTRELSTHNLDCDAKLIQVNARSAQLCIKSNVFESFFERLFVRSEKEETMTIRSASAVHLF